MMTVTEIINGSKVRVYSSIQFNLPYGISNKISDYVDLHISNKNIIKREDEFHITVLFGIHDALPYRTIKLLKNTFGFDPIPIKLGKITKFRQSDYDVLKIDVNDYSDRLREMFSLVNCNVDNSNEYQNYCPHVSLAYVEKNQYEDLINDSFFEGEKITLKKFKFSSSDTTKTVFINF